MKLTARNLSTFLVLLALGAIIGTLAWEIVERIISLAGAPLDLRVGPIGFDSGVLSVELLINPGTIIGAAAGYRMFRTT